MPGKDGCHESPNKIQIPHRRLPDGRHAVARAADIRCTDCAVLLIAANLRADRRDYLRSGADRPAGRRRQRYLPAHLYFSAICVRLHRRVQRDYRAVRRPRRPRRHPAVVCRADRPDAGNLRGTDGNVCVHAAVDAARAARHTG